MGIWQELTKAYAVDRVEELLFAGNDDRTEFTDNVAKVITGATDRGELGSGLDSLDLALVLDDFAPAKNDILIAAQVYEKWENDTALFDSGKWNRNDYFPCTDGYILVSDDYDHYFDLGDTAANHEVTVINRYHTVEYDHEPNGHAQRVVEALRWSDDYFETLKKLIARGVPIGFISWHYDTFYTNDVDDINTRDYTIVVGENWESLAIEWVASRYLVSKVTLESVIDSDGEIDSAVASGCFGGYIPSDVNRYGTGHITAQDVSELDYML